MIKKLDGNIDFIGKDSLKKIKRDGVKRKQIGLELKCKPLKGPNTRFWSITVGEKKVGKVTSAVYSPRLKKNIALAMVEIQQSKLGNDLTVNIDDVKVASKVIEKPFFEQKIP